MKSSVIIIGSGLGGMACGILLARSGCPVTILEQNAIPGGCLQRFRRGNAAFDTGMHYIGSMAPGETLHTLFQQLGIDDDLPLSPLDPMGYDVVALGGKCYAFAAGREAFLKEMLKAFPEEEMALTRYADLIDETAKAASWQNSDETTVAARLTEASQTSLDEMLRRLTTNERLRQVLAARLPLMPPRANAPLSCSTPSSRISMPAEPTALSAGEKPYSRFSGSASKPWGDNS